MELYKERSEMERIARAIMISKRVKPEDLRLKTKD